jgi:hypothetical protein
VLTRLLDLGKGLAIYSGHIDDVREQDVNAQVMPPEMLERLTQTVKRDQRIEALPLTVLRKAATDGRPQLEMISGHHRLRAARTAGLTELHFIVDETDLDRSQVVAKQLAHNRIHGESDQATVKRLFDEIQSVEDMLDTYIRPEDFDGVKQLSAAGIPKIGVEIKHRRISFMFLDRNVERLTSLNDIAKELHKDTHLVGVVDLELFERFRKAVLELGTAKHVRSMGALVTMMVEMLEDRIHEPPEEGGDGG